MSCNGFTNYETQILQMWINSEGYPIDANRKTVQEVADELREWISDLSSNVFPKACLMSDLVNCAVRKINFDEIANNLIEDSSDE